MLEKRENKKKKGGKKQKEKKKYVRMHERYINDRLNDRRSDKPSPPVHEADGRTHFSMLFLLEPDGSRLNARAIFLLSKSGAENRALSPPLGNFITPHRAHFSHMRDSVPYRKRIVYAAVV